MTFELQPELPARFMRELLDCRVQALVNGKVVADRIIRYLPVARDTQLLLPIHLPVKAGDVVLGKLLSAGLVAPSCGFKLNAAVVVLCEVEDGSKPSLRRTHTTEPTG